jgi:HK97 family phage major capsid protein
MTDELIYYGDAIKAEQTEFGVKLGGYLVRFGDPSNTDLTGDYFTKLTDYGDAKQSTVWFNHRMPVKLKKVNKQVSYTEALPKANLTMDDTGVFAEVVIEARNEYEKTIAELGLAGKLAWSSGTASHLVDRKNIKNGVTEITRWHLGLDASLTPTPAEFRQTNQVMPIKSLIASDFAVLSVADDKTIKHSKEVNKMEELDVKAVTEKAVADALAKRDAEMKTQADAKAAQDAAIKEAADNAYKKAIEDVKAAGPTFYHSTMTTDDDNDGVGAFKSWMQTGQENNDLIRPDGSFDKIKSAKAAWNVTTGGSGGFLVPDPLYNQIIAKRNIASWVRQLPVQSFTTPSDHLLVPRESTSHTNFVLTAEAAAYNEDEGTVTQKDLILYKYTKLTKVNDEFLMYQGTNWESWFSNAMGRAVAGTENTIYTTGTGTGQPEGVLVGATVANTTAVTDVILPSELTALIGYLGGGYNVPSECGFLMRNATKWYLKGSGGTSVVPFAYVGTPQGGDFFGYPAVVSDDMEDYTTGSSKPVLFGNFNYYGVVEKPGMIVQRNPYLYMANGQVGIFASIFRGGGVLQSEAFYYLTNHS